MKRFLGIILVIIFFVSCGKKKPEGIFSEQKMVNLLLDLHLADGYVSSFPMDSIENKKVNVYLSVYQKHGTDSAAARENLTYYAAHPQEMENIYAEISKLLQQQEKAIQEVEMLKYREVFKKDSTARKVIADSLHLLQRDSAVNFIGLRDLFIQPDTSSISIKKNQRMESMYTEQKRWEMIFYYFGPSNFQSLRPGTSIMPLREDAVQPRTPLKREGNMPVGPIKERIPN